MLYNLDVMAIIIFTETAMKEKAECFGNAENNQFIIMKEAGLLYLSAFKNNESVHALLTLMYSERKPLLVEINLLAKNIYARLTKLYPQKLSTYFGQKTASETTDCIKNSFNFIIKCKDLIDTINEKCEIYNLKPEVNELYEQVISIQKSKKDSNLSKKGNTADINDLEQKWFEEFLLLELAIKSKAVKGKFDAKDFIKRIPLKKRVKAKKDDSKKSNGKKGKDVDIVLINKAE